MTLLARRAALAALTVLIACGAIASSAVAADRPNILWITCEDISPDLGCYGVSYAVTPALDRLAAQGVRYTRAFAPIGVCAPSRSSLITGVYAPSIGTHHMRCTGTLPQTIKAFPEYLRRAGYYCTNNVKTDYNFTHDPATWDESSATAHWRQRRERDQPFFSVFNFTTSHESQIRLPERQYVQRTKDFTPAERHDPARAPLPPFHPDAPEVRRDWARYHDMITYMDKQSGDLLRQLDDDGLAENTIVFFFSDHGAGMPRYKRWLYDTSTHVPFLVRAPERYRRLAPGTPGSTSDRLIDFTDLAPTVLSLVGLTVPPYMQGRAFLGGQAAEPREYVYGFRDRMDERYDMLRSVRDARFKYIRNYQPQLPWFGSQYISYMYEMPTMQVWQRLADAGRLSGPQALFMAPTKPTEELYDTQADPFEIRNLANSPAHEPTLQRLRAEHRRWMSEIGDLGLLPEADLRTRFGAEPAYAAIRRDPQRYPFARIAAAADVATKRDASALPRLLAWLDDPDPAVRYWAAEGLGVLAEKASPVADRLRDALHDPAPIVRVAAADALCRQGRPGDALPTLAKALNDENEWVRLLAVNILDRLGAAARPAMAVIAQAQKDPYANVALVAKHAMGNLGD